MNERSEGELGRREEELLTELLLGDPEGDARAAERVGASPAVRARLSELRAGEARLAARGASARAEAIERARAAGPVPGEERALAALGRAMEGGSVARPPALLRRLVPWLVAAAALVALWLALPRGDRPERGAGVLLGDEASEGFAPRGVVRAFEVFEWPAPAAPGSVQRVRAWPGETALGRAPVESPDLEDATRWTPSPEERARLGARFVWRVVDLDPLGRADESPLLSVELAP